jgi:hypothetical protein
MVGAGQAPLDRAHAHARWAERYNAQNDPVRAAAHFGRAMHYAQAFGGPKLKRARDADEADEADRGDIRVGLWEDGGEVWYTLHGLFVKRHQLGGGAMQRPGKPPDGLLLELPQMLDRLYESELGATVGVHGDTAGRWYIHRCVKTGIVCLVPFDLARDEDGVSVRSIVKILDKKLHHKLVTTRSYTSSLQEGLLIVQDQRRGCVQVKRDGGAGKRKGRWEAATELETFAYYDFLLRHPWTVHHYHSEKKAREQRELFEHSDRILKQFEARWTTVPSVYYTKQSEDLRLTIRRDISDGVIRIGEGDDIKHTKSEISDVAYR